MAENKLNWGRMMKSLSQAEFNKSVQIDSVFGAIGLTRRLREMGFHSGCTVRVLSRAPFNGPYLVLLHDSVLALRAAEVACLFIK